MMDRLGFVKHRYTARRLQLLGESSTPSSPSQVNQTRASSSSSSSSRIFHEHSPRESSFFLPSSSSHHDSSRLLCNFESTSGTFFSCRRGTWIRAILALIVVIRFLWNIYWLHNIWVPQSLFPSVPTSSDAYHRKQRQSSTLTDFRDQWLQQLQLQQPPSRVLQVMPPDEASSSTFKAMEKQPENPFVLERRLERQKRTTPPRYRIDITAASSQGNDKGHNSVTTMTTTGTWVETGEQIDLSIPPNKNDWTNLCLEASFDSNSKVVISGALTQPPGQALALLLAQKCGVNEFLVVDPLFPNSNLERIQQMDIYKTLKRALPSVKLLIPSAEPAIPDMSVHTIAQYLPTHMIHLETKVRDYSPVMDGRNDRIYSYRTSLKAMRDILQVSALLTEAISSNLPKLVIVVPSSSSSSRNRDNDSPAPSNNNNNPSTQLQTILARSYHGMYGFPIAYLQLPNIYGPLVATLESYVFKTDDNDDNEEEQQKEEEGDDQEEEQEEEEQEEEGEKKPRKRDLKHTRVDMGKFIYVDEAIDGILQSFRDEYHDTGITLLRGKSRVLNEKKDNADKNDDNSWENVQSNRLEETRSWETGEANDHLGNAIIDAAYLDMYGVPQTFFPCSSNCDSWKCTPSAVDDIRNVTYQATENCDYVIYFFDFSPKLSYLEEPTQEEESTDSYYVVCRVAILSYKSGVVRKSLLSKEDYENGNQVPREILQAQNGKQVMKQWILVWMYDFADERDRDLSSALLRIDPSNLFHPQVTKVMYTEAPAFMRASDARLVDTFAEMRRDRTGKQYKKVRRPGVNGVYQVLVPAQKSRKVLFYGKEPKNELPDSLDKFVRHSEDEISEKQIEFYKESEEAILSDTLRSPQDRSLNVYSTFPYQWLGTSVFVHDLTMKHSQEFRCRWLREFQFWEGSLDVEVLSFAYLFGKQRLQGLYGPRLDHDETSWIPLMDLERERRLWNARGWELFIRIVESQ